MKPILFNTDMVRAILADRKTVTRRVVKPQEKILDNPEFGYTAFTPKGYISIRGGWIDSDGDKRYGENFIKLPYRLGDILYVRETWCINNITPNDSEWSYKADYDCSVKPYCNWEWHPSVHMPREAARIFLRATDVGVERLQDIDDDGVVAEGLEIGAPFDELWDSTVKPADRELYGWDTNPWVFVITFERISKEEVNNAD